MKKAEKAPKGTTTFTGDIIPRYHGRGDGASLYYPVILPQIATITASTAVAASEQTSLLDLVNPKA